MINSEKLLPKVPQAGIKPGPHIFEREMRMRIRTIDCDGVTTTHGEPNEEQIYHDKQNDIIAKALIDMTRSLIVNSPFTKQNRK